MGKSKFTQSEISAARRVYNAYMSNENTKSFYEFLSEEAHKGFRDSVENLDVAPFRIVKSNLKD